MRYLSIVLKNGPKMMISGDSIHNIWSVKIAGVMIIPDKFFREIMELKKFISDLVLLITHYHHHHHYW